MNPTPSEVSTTSEASVSSEASTSTMFDFSLFEQLPAEVRKIIYDYALKSDKPIRPHLCDVSFPHERAKFHDDNAAHHNSTFELTNLTRASRKLREESLLVFYAANSFDGTGKDTATYFAWLESVGRLDCVLHVNLIIPYHRNSYSTRILWTVSGFDKQVEEHVEKCHHLGRAETFANTPLSVEHLREHPRYLVGGVPDLNLWIMLRMLSTSSVTSAESGLKKRIVLPVSNVSAFETDSKLRWLSTVARGLDMELRLVEQPGTATLHGGQVHQWNRKYQGKNVAVPGPNEGSGEDVMRRAKEVFSEIEKIDRPDKSCFYREPCFRSKGTITWFDMPTMGGGRT